MMPVGWLWMYCDTCEIFGGIIPLHVVEFGTSFLVISLLYQDYQGCIVCLLQPIWW